MKKHKWEKLEKEAEEILREVEQDLEVAGLTVPEDFDKKMYDRIQKWKKEHR